MQLLRSLFELRAVVEPAAVAWTTQLKRHERALPRDPMPDHDAVYDAIVDKKPEAAAAAMRKLVDLALADTRAAPNGEMA
ncbi:hypothetical protein ASE88_03255 [Sphingomonas sp. Leaf38]|nr:hypothetical protein ASE88_03255 [Sphingomonas sp. Leaf38]